MNEILTFGFFAGLVGNVLTAPLGELLTNQLTPSVKSQLATHYEKVCRKVAQAVGENEGLTPAQITDLADIMLSNHKGLYEMAVEVEQNYVSGETVAVALINKLHISLDNVSEEKMQRIILYYLQYFVPTFYEEMQDNTALQTWQTLLTTYQTRKMLFQTQVSQVEHQKMLEEIKEMLSQLQPQQNDIPQSLSLRDKLLAMTNDGDLQLIFLEMNKLPELQTYAYNRLKKIASAGFTREIERIDFIDQLKVFIQTYVKS